MTQRLVPMTILLFNLALTGCGLSKSSLQTTVAPAVGIHTTGAVHGGQQPVANSTIQLYEIGNAGYFAPARPMLAQVTTTNSSGAFFVSENYTCTAGNQIYLTSTGGNPGLAAGTNNSALALMAPLGECSYLLANRANIFLNLNEVTTIVTAWSLSRFMSSPTNAGTSSGNSVGLANAFANITNVVNLQTGTLPGPTLPAGATVPIAEIYTLANILATCINTDGNLSQGSPCTQLFVAATPSGGVAPSDTITAALNMARNPTQNVRALYNLPSPTPPFGPTLLSPPDNWLVGIRFTGGGLSQPAALAVDGAGNVWTANIGNNSVSLFTATGAPLSPTTGFTDTSLAQPSAIAIDSVGNAWVANAGGTSLTSFTPAGTVSQTLATNLSSPNGIAFDGSGNGWVLSPGTSALVEFGSNQAFLQQIPLSTPPLAIAINPK